MDDLPAKIRLVECRSGRACDAALVRLTRKLAATRIDGEWWKLSGQLKGNPEEEDDHHWVWRKLVGEHRNDLAWEFVAAQTENEAIQGAIAYRIDARSFPDPDLPSVYVDRIVVAPRNRARLVSEPHFKGVGVGLLLRAVCHSYLLGLGGRVNLSSFPREGPRTFYQKRGFIAVAEDDEGLIEYELSGEAAQEWLSREGYL